MKCTHILTAIFALYAAGVTGYALADVEQPAPDIMGPVIETRFITDGPCYYEVNSISGLQGALNDSDIDQRDFRVSVYDCREFSAALENHLTNFGFDCGTVSLIYPDNIGHRIVWTRINDTLYFVEPQTDEILAEHEIKERYPDTQRMTLHNFNIEVKRDEVRYYEN
jgi:hypothetical protein